jgi:hypothetical protein
MAPVRTVPYLPWDIVWFCSCHGYNAILGPKNRNIGPFLGGISGLFSVYAES